MFLYKMLIELDFAWGFHRSQETKDIFLKFFVVLLDNRQFRNPRFYSWTTFLVEVSGHKLESSCLVFLPSFLSPTKCFSCIDSVSLFLRFFKKVFETGEEVIFFKIRYKRLWLARSKSFESCVKLMSKNSISGHTELLADKLSWPERR